MFDFKDLDSAKRQTAGSIDTRQAKFNQLYNGGVDLLKKFSQTRQNAILIESARQFFDASKIIKNSPETYLYLAYIFYILGDNQVSFKYLNVYSLLEKNPQNIIKLKNLLSTDKPSGAGTGIPVKSGSGTVKTHERINIINQSK